MYHLNSDLQANKSIANDSGARLMYLYFPRTSAVIVTVPNVTKTSGDYRKFMTSDNLINKIPPKSPWFALFFQIRMRGCVGTIRRALLIGVSVLADDRMFIPAQ
jgi:hypothetical protein